MTDKQAEAAVLAAASAILEAEFAKAPAEACPQGEECGVHHRVNEDVILEDYKYARLITYSGDYVVITSDNPELGSPAMLVKAVLGTLTSPPPRWETVIIHVGSGPLAVLEGSTMAEYNQAIRYRKTHDQWQWVGGIHRVTVDSLQLGMIDVSKPVEG